MSWINFSFALVGWCVLLYVGIISLTYWDTHREMTKRGHKPCGKAGYKEFRREFEKREWIKMKGYDDCLEAEDGSRIFASTFTFDGKEMLIRNPFSYMMCYLKHTKYYKKKYPKRKLNEVKW